MTLRPRRLLRLVDRDGNVEPVSAEQLRPFDLVYCVELGQSHIGRRPSLVVLAVDAEGNEAEA